jgi:hypothetical protein
VQLPSGISLHDSLLTASSSVVYRVSLPPGSVPGTSVLIQGTALSGFPVLYLSAGAPGSVNTAPSSLSSLGVSRFADNYRFNLSPAFLAASCPNLASSGCEVYVSAFAEAASSLPVTFGLTAVASSDGVAPTVLLAGMPQLGSVAAGSWAYFLVPLPLSSPGAVLSVTLQELVGSVGLWGATSGSFPGLAGSGATGWGSAPFANPKLLVLRPGSAGYAAALASGFLSIGVQGSAPFSQFFITASSSSGVTALPDGASITGTTEVGATSYYSLAVPGDGSTLFLGISQFSGRADVCGSVWFSSEAQAAAAQSFRPAAGSGCTWIANPEGTLVISASDPASCSSGGAPCTYIFAVSCGGSVPCNYQLVATGAASALVRAADGIPSTTELQAQGSYRYFIYDAGRPAKNVSISAIETAGQVRVLVSGTWFPGISPPSQLPRLDNLNSFQQLSPLGDPTLSFFSPSGGAPPDGSPVASSGGLNYVNSIYVIAVYASLAPASFALVVRSTEGATVLQPGVPSAGESRLCSQLCSSRRSAAPHSFAQLRSLSLFPPSLFSLSLLCRPCAGLSWQRPVHL